MSGSQGPCRPGSAVSRIVLVLVLVLVWSGAVSCSVQPSTTPRRVAIVSVFHAADLGATWARNSVHSLQCYAARHGYTFIPRLAPRLDDAAAAYGHANGADAAAAGATGQHLLALGAVDALLAFTSHYDWVLLLEGGSVVTNPSVGLDGFVAAGRRRVQDAGPIPDPIKLPLEPLRRVCGGPGTLSMALQGTRVFESGAVLVGSTACARQLLVEWRWQLSHPGALRMP